MRGVSLLPLRDRLAMVAADASSQSTLCNNVYQSPASSKDHSSSSGPNLNDLRRARKMKLSRSNREAGAANFEVCPPGPTPERAASYKRPARPVSRRSHPSRAPITSSSSMPPAPLVEWCGLYSFPPDRSAGRALVADNWLTSPPSPQAIQPVANF